MRSVNKRGRFAAFVAATALAAAGILGTTAASASEIEDGAQSGDSTAQGVDIPEDGQESVDGSEAGESSEEGTSEEMASEEAEELGSDSSAERIEMSLADVKVMPEKQGGACVLNYELTGRVDGLEWDWGEEGALENLPDVEVTAAFTERGQDEPAFTASARTPGGDIENDGSFSIRWYVRAGAGDGEGEGSLQSLRGTMDIEVKLFVDKEEVGAPTLVSADYDITAGCIKIIDVSWSPNPAKIVAPAKTVKATLSGKVEIPEGFDTSLLRGVGICNDRWGPGEPTLWADINPDGTWSYEAEFGLDDIGSYFTLVGVYLDGDGTQWGYGERVSDRLWAVPDSESEFFPPGDFKALVVEKGTATGGGGGTTPPTTTPPTTTPPGGTTPGGGSGGSGSLAQTGADLKPLAAGLGALVVGAGVLALVRRRAA